MVHCVIALEDYVSAAENSYAGERSYETGLRLSEKFVEQNYYKKMKLNIISNLVNVFTIFYPFFYSFCNSFNE